MHALRRAGTGADLGVGALLALLTALLLAPAFVAADSEFDEGILVAFPTRVLQGDLPYRDFETFYGPAQPYVTAAVFHVFGSRLGAERAVGFAVRLLLVVALYRLLLPWGRVAAFAGGILGACVAAAGGVTFDSDLAAQALGLVALALAWRSLRRDESGSLVAAGFVAFAALPAAASELASRRPAAGALAAGAAVLGLFLGVHYVRGGVARNAKLALGRTHSHLVSYAGRDFRVDNARAARNLQRAVDATARLAPRDGSLFVGPTDLRRTAGNDVFVYYLFPHLRPASFYVELDPPASKRGSGLARDVARANVLLLGRRWNREAEPNGSRRVGSAAPNRVVRRRFCRRAAFGGYEVLTRCRRGGA
jgi:hypothetical protein